MTSPEPHQPLREAISGEIGHSEQTAPDPAPPRGGDHGLHVADEMCTRCGEAILPTDEARRTATGGCVHLNC